MSCPRGAERSHDRTLARVLDVDREDLVRLVEHAVDLLGDDARDVSRDLVTLAPHVLEQHAEMQLAASVDLELVRVLGFLDAQRDVGQRLAQETLARSAGW